MKYLKNRNSGAVFPFHETLLRNKNMEPCTQDGKSLVEEVEAAAAPDQQPGEADRPETATMSDDIELFIDKAKKSELIKFAQDNFGVTIENDQGVADVRLQVKKLFDVEG